MSLQNSKFSTIYRDTFHNLIKKKEFIMKRHFPQFRYIVKIFEFMLKVSLQETSLALKLFPQFLIYIGFCGIVESVSSNNIFVEFFFFWIREGVSSRDIFSFKIKFMRYSNLSNCGVEGVFSRDTFNFKIKFMTHSNLSNCGVEGVFSRDTFSINPIFWNCWRDTFNLNSILLNMYHDFENYGRCLQKTPSKTVVDLSIFFQLPFFNNYFLKLLQKLKKPPREKNYWETLGRQQIFIQFNCGKGHI